MKPMKLRYALLNPDHVTHRLVRNPNYGGVAVSLNGWRTVRVQPATRKRRFFEQMRASIRQEGFRNPILVYSLPEGLFLSFGCSRLRVAKEEQVLIPAIIMDYTDKFQLDTLVTEDNWTEFFTDVPDYYEFGEYGFEYHYSLERNRRHDYDPKGMAWAEAKDIDDSFIGSEFGWIKRN